MSRNFDALRCTEYRADGTGFLVIFSPHGADPEPFLQKFPEIQEHPQIKSIWPIFEAYLGIEQDQGASELAHALAHHSARYHDIPTRVLEVTYPRAIVDGGRQLAHCLRGCLPNDLAQRLRQEFLALHQDTLDTLQLLYQELRSRPQAALIDLHTMASFCPTNIEGQRSTFPVSWPSLQDYVNQYTEAYHHAHYRCIDLLSADDSGRRFADNSILTSLKTELAEAGYPIKDNEPYCASDPFLCLQHMKAVRSLSIDVPKHLLARWENPLDDYELESVPLCAEKISRLASVIGQGLTKALHQPSAA